MGELAEVLLLGMRDIARGAEADSTGAEAGVAESKSDGGAADAGAASGAGGAASGASEGVPLVQRKAAALEELDDLVGSIDNAKNLFVVGAFPALLLVATHPGEAVTPLTASGDSGVAVEGLTPAEQLRIATRAAEVVTTVVQNNPKAQGWALDGGALGGLTHMLGVALARLQAGAVAGSDAAVGEAAAAVAKYAAACLTAVSALLRDNARGQRIAIWEAEPAAAVPPVLQHALAVAALWPAPCTDGEWPQRKRLLKKGLFFLRHLAHGPQADAVKSVLVDDAGAGALATLMRMLAALPATPAGVTLTSDDDDVAECREQVLEVLTAIVSPSPPPVEVVDDSDNRALRVGADGRKHVVISVKAPGASDSTAAHSPSAGAGAAAGAGTGSGAPLLLGDGSAGPSADNAVPPAGAVAASAPAPAPAPARSLPMLTLGQRTKALLTCAPPHAPAAEAAGGAAASGGSWVLDAVAAAYPGGGEGGPREGEVAAGVALAGKLAQAWRVVQAVAGRT
jgi:hypothetical protein